MLCTLIGAIILSINIQVGLDMHLYDDIGDASSSLRGSTSSFSFHVKFFCFTFNFENTIPEKKRNQIAPRILSQFCPARPNDLFVPSSYCKDNNILIVDKSNCCSVKVHLVYTRGMIHLLKTYWFRMFV